MMMNAWTSALLLNAPPIACLAWRLWGILSHHGKVMAFESKKAVTTGRPSDLCFTVHVIVGLLLFLVVPFLVYLQIPGHMERQSARGLLAGTALALAMVNFAVFGILPHPSHYKAYDVRSRAFIRGLSVLHLPAAQYGASALSAFALLVNEQTIWSTCMMLFCIATYAVTILISLLEVVAPEFPWEDQQLAKFYFALLPNFRSVKSKRSPMTVAAVNAPPENHFIVFLSMLVTGPPAMVQCWFMLCRRGPTATPFSDFFAAGVTLQTLLMSIGFFTTTQSHASSLSKLVEILLTQLLPVFIVVHGMYFTGHTAFASYFFDFQFWRDPALVSTTIPVVSADTYLVGLSDVNGE